jgi:hypothetical protein
VIQRRTQTATYWQQDFDFLAEDLSQVYEEILDRGQPVSTADLARLVMEQHCRREEEDLRAGLGDGRLYRPKDRYETGETLVFPALGLMQGKVVGDRPGRSPDYGEFTAIRVEFEGSDGGGEKIREFASGLEGEHTLNQYERVEDLMSAGELRGVAELYDAYGPAVEEQLVSALSDHEEFVQYKEEWFLRELLAVVQDGHLHIAEALIEIRAMPLQPTEFLADLDLPAEIPEAVRILSINHAMEADERFDNIGDSGRDIWYLRRLIPQPVVSPPDRLQRVDEPYDRSDISPELLAIEREIDDEGSGEEVWGPTRRIYRASVGLTFAHWRCGTLPLTVRVRGLFPEATRHHTPVVLVDGQTGDKMQGWIVHEASFVYGLEGWYEQYRLPVGATIRLERTRDPRVITVDFQPQPLRPLWLKVATAQAGKLTFQVRKSPIACEYDELLAIGEDNPTEIDKLWSASNSRGDTLYQIMVQLMPGLVELSPQGTVHAKTIYTAVNVLKRVAPGPIFALLSTEPAFVAMGGGYWTFDEANVNEI